MALASRGFLPGIFLPRRIPRHTNTHEKERFSSNETQERPVQAPTARTKKAGFPAGPQTLLSEEN
jgi:hypothetical protein